MKPIKKLSTEFINEVKGLPSIPKSNKKEAPKKFDDRHLLVECGNKIYCVTVYPDIYNHLTT